MPAVAAVFDRRGKLVLRPGEYVRGVVVATYDGLVQVRDSASEVTLYATAEPGLCVGSEVTVDFRFVARAI